MGLLGEAIRDHSRGVILYEIIPPTQGNGKGSLEAYAACVAEVAASTRTPIDAINLPEIRSEQRADPRTHPFEPKTDPREFSRALRVALGRSTEIIVNHCTVYEDWPKQRAWLEATQQEYGVANLVLVGGETSRIQYPGPSVTDLARFIQENYDHTFLCGGITIPTRRSQDPVRDEPHRLLHKARHGLEFFTSQVIYESESVKRLLSDYQRLCEKAGEEPKRIFLSFAPVSSRKDLAFIKWLGVEIPAHVEEKLLNAEIGIGWRSLQIAQRVLAEILEFATVETIGVPLGLNIEHITRHNFELSKDFIDQLGAIYSAHPTTRRRV